MSCTAVRARLREAALARRATDPEDRRHGEGCPACGRELRFLEALVVALDSERTAPPTEELLARCRSAARDELRALQVPRGFGWALARALGVALLALPLVIGQAWLVAQGASTLLAPWLPELALLWLGGIYFGSLALAVGLFYGSIPVLVAVRAARRSEATS